MKAHCPAVRFRFPVPRGSGDVEATCFDGRQAQAGSKRRRYLAQLRLLRFDDPKGLQVDGVLFGEDPAASSLDRGAVVMIMATVGPAAVQRWVERLGQQHIEVVDAPVSGGVRRAAEGELLVMVGGADSAVQRVQPVLDAMAGRAPVVGPAPGDGQKVKRVNQLLCGVHIAAAAEALAYAEAMGLDAAATWQVIREGAAASFMLDDRGERMVQPSDEVKAHSTSSSTGWAS